MLGISAHDKMDLSLKAKLLEEAVETPYRRSGKKATEALEISGQTVMNTIRELGSLANCDAHIKGSLTLLNLTDYLKIYDTRSRPKFEIKNENEKLLKAFKEKDLINKFE